MSDAVSSHVPADNFSIIEAALELFAAFAAGDREAIKPDIRSGIYTAAMKHSKDTKAFESLLTFARETTAADQYSDAWRGLGNIRDPALMNSVLELVLTDEMKPQDVGKPTPNRVSVLI